MAEIRFVMYRISSRIDCEKYSMVSLELTEFFVCIPQVMPGRRSLVSRRQYLPATIDRVVQAAQIGVGISLVVPRRGEFLMDGQRQIVTFEGQMELPQPAQHDAAIVPCVEVERVAVKVFIVAPQGVFKLVKVVVAVSQLIPCFPVIGIPFQRKRRFCAASQTFPYFSRVTALLKRASSWEGSIWRARSKRRRAHQGVRGHRA